MARDPDAYKDSATRSKPSQQRGKERVRIILSAALELFRASGFDGVTTNEIAARAGIPIGSLYRYFPHKESIIVALTDLYVKDVSVIFDDVAGTPLFGRMSWDEALLMMTSGWLNYATLNGSLMFLDVESSGPDLRQHRRAARDALLRAFRRAIKKRFPRVTMRQSEVCFRLCITAIELGLDDTEGDALEMCYEIAAAAAQYMEAAEAE